MSRGSFFIRVLKLGKFELTKRGLGIGDHTEPSANLSVLCLRCLARKPEHLESRMILLSPARL